MGRHTIENFLSDIQAAWVNILMSISKNTGLLWF